jgi:hypothetical protein
LGRKFGLLYAGLVGSVLGVGPGGLTVAVALVPPFDEVASLRMGFVFSVDPDVIPAHSALAIEKGAGMPPPVVDFNLL